MARVFLSHAKANRVEARRIAEALRRAGREPWIADDEVRPGEPIPSAIVRGLESTDYVVAILSRQGLASGWLQGELELFVLPAFTGRLGRILPVRLEAVDLPGRIRNLRAVDVFPKGAAYEQGISELLAAIARGATEPPLPPNNLPPQRLFVNCTAELERIDAVLSRRGGQATIVGPAGGGKTAFALAHAYQAGERGAYPGGIWWLSAEGEPRTALGILAPILSEMAPSTVRDVLAIVPEGAPPEEAATAVSRALQGQTATALLIVDNVERAGWAEIVPRGAVRVLMTARDAAFGAGERLKLSASSLVAIDRVLDHVSYGTPAYRLLLGAAVFAPEALPQSWAEAASGLAGDEAKEARRALEALGLLLVDEDQGLLFMPSVVRSQVRKHAESEHGDALRAVGARAAAEVAAWLGEAKSPARMGEVDARQAHIEEALAAAERAKNERTWIDIAGALGEHSQRGGRYEVARALLEGAVRKAEKLEPPDEHLQAKYLDQLATMLVDQGLHHDARPALERALAATQRAYGPNHRNIVSILLLLVAIGEQGPESQPLLERAIAIVESIQGSDGEMVGNRLLERALAIVEKIHGHEHPAVANTLSDLASTLLAQGRPAQARPLFERALAMREKHYGPERSEVAVNLALLAAVLCDLGEGTEALPLVERALMIYEKSTAPDNEHIVDALSRSAKGLRNLRYLPAARHLLQRLLKVVMRVYEHDHSRVLEAIVDLAVVLSPLDHPSDALSFLESAVGITEKVRGPDHPDVAALLLDLAMVLRDLGRPAEARPLLERALRLCERAEDHARAAAAAYRLGELHGREGGWETARRLFERGLKLAKRVDSPVLVAEGYRLIADAALHGLDYENAQLCYEEAIRRWDALDRPREAADARLLLVTLLLQLGRSRGGARHVAWLRAHLDRPELSLEARREIEDVLRLASAADVQERPDEETTT